MVPLIENLIDIEVAFNPDINGLSLNTFGSQLILDEHFCRYDWPKSSPSLSTLKKGTAQSIVGFSLAGVPIFSGTSEYGKDALISFNTTPHLDTCLGSNDPT